MFIFPNLEKYILRDFFCQLAITDNPFGKKQYQRIKFMEKIIKSQLVPLAELI